MSARLPVYLDVHAFYAAHEAARTSPESDYGVWWRDDDGGIWGVSYVHRTGHVYALRTSRWGMRSRMVRIGAELVAAVDAGRDSGPLIILAQIEPWTEKEELRRAFGARAHLHPDPFEQRVPRWADWCGEQGSLARLRAALLADEGAARP